MLDEIAWHRIHRSNHCPGDFEAVAEGFHVVVADRGELHFRIQLGAVIQLPVDDGERRRAAATLEHAKLRRKQNLEGGDCGGFEIAVIIADHDSPRIADCIHWARGDHHRTQQALDEGCRRLTGAKRAHHVRDALWRENEFARDRPRRHPAHTLAHRHRRTISAIGLRRQLPTLRRRNIRLRSFLIAAQFRTPTRRMSEKVRVPFQNAASANKDRRLRNAKRFRSDPRWASRPAPTPPVTRGGLHDAGNRGGRASRDTRLGAIATSSTL
jgi:hypothetical protein